jgi:RNA-directed DNA polymerase
VDPVPAVQHALYRAAKADLGRRFQALGDKIYRRDVLWRAWVTVYRHGGTPGIDQITLANVEQRGVDLLLDELAGELRERRYRPLPTRRIDSQARHDRAAPVVDSRCSRRIVQVAVKIALKPIFEADMLRLTSDH